jgi:predicted transcriptional regulator
MEKKTLIKMIENDMSQYEMAKLLDCSQSNIRYWLKKYELKTNNLSFKEIGIKCYTETKYCVKCCENKNINYFYKRRGNIGGSAYCIECTKTQYKERHNQFKKELVNYKGGCCQNCGYDKYYGALEFHHLDPNEKDFSFGNVKSFTLNDKMKSELDKCVLLCANCHRETHAGLNEI